MAQNNSRAIPTITHSDYDEEQAGHRHVAQPNGTTNNSNGNGNSSPTPLDYNSEDDEIEVLDESSERDDSKEIADTNGAEQNGEQRGQSNGTTNCCQAMACANGNGTATLRPRYDSGGELPIDREIIQSLIRAHPSTDVIDVDEMIAADNREKERLRKETEKRKKEQKDKPKEPKREKERAKREKETKEKLKGNGNENAKEKQKENVMPSITVGSASLAESPKRPRHESVTDDDMADMEVCSLTSSLESRNNRSTNQTTLRRPIPTFAPIQLSPTRLSSNSGMPASRPMPVSTKPTNYAIYPGLPVPNSPVKFIDFSPNSRRCMRPCTCSFGSNGMSGTYGTERRRKHSKSCPHHVEIDENNRDSESACSCSFESNGTNGTGRVRKHSESCAEYGKSDDSDSSPYSNGSSSDDHMPPNIWKVEDYVEPVTVPDDELDRIMKSFNVVPDAPDHQLPSTSGTSKYSKESKN